MFGPFKIIFIKQCKILRHQIRRPFVQNCSFQCFVLYYLQTSLANYTFQLLLLFSAMSRPTLCNPWTVAHQAPQSVGFPRQEYWSGLPFPPPGALPDPGIQHWQVSPAWQVDSLLLSHLGSPDIRVIGNNFPDEKLSP